VKETSQIQKKKRKRQLTTIEQITEDTAIKNAAQVTEALNELEAQGVNLDIQVCPKCKSPRLKRVESTGGDIFGNMGLTPPSYKCSDCGWQERLILKATNKRWNVKDVELIREAMDLEDETSE
jgi:transposase-like protein